jgi:RimJ/RimL family protein N-acetyltransferase
MKLPDFLNNFFHNRKKREELSENSRHLVDGRGAERVSIFLVESLLQVRKARADDCWMIYHWANDPYIREISFNTSPISPEEHKDWFFSQIRNPNVMYFILENKDCIPVGQVRFDIDDNNATISIIIAPEFRGINYGTRAMLFSSEILFNQSDVQYIHAFIKKNNTVSYKAFKRAGYRDSGICWKDSFEAHHLIFERV